MKHINLLFISLFLAMFLITGCNSKITDYFKPSFEGTYVGYMVFSNHSDYFDYKGEIKGLSEELNGNDTAGYIKVQLKVKKLNEKEYLVTYNFLNIKTFLETPISKAFQDEYFKENYNSLELLKKENVNIIFHKESDFGLFNKNNTSSEHWKSETITSLIFSPDMKEFILGNETKTDIYDYNGKFIDSKEEKSANRFIKEGL